MKGILVIIDGLGDLPNKKLDEKTPLEAAETPNMDFLANRGEIGYMFPIKPGVVPGSDEAIVSIFGNELISSTRGQLEARGAGIKLTRGDLALRTNFATIDSLKKGNMIDRRVGRTLTTKEAEILEKAINEIKLPCKFIFKSTIQHRGVLVFKGGFSDNIWGNDVHYHKSPTDKDKVCFSKPLDDDENSQYSANLLNEFFEKTYDVLKNHPINKERRKKGLMPANYLLVRGPGIETPKLKFYKKWASAKCKDAQLKIKPLLITRRKVSRAVRKNLRENAKKDLIDYVQDKNAETLFEDLLQNKIQKTLSIKLKKIYPLSLCEIRVFAIEKKNE